MSWSTGFSRAVGILTGGTVVAHGITALAMLVLTRQYTPANFGVYAAFSAVLAIVAVVLCMRYEIAIAISTNDDEAANLFAVAVLFSLAISIAIAVATALWGASLADHLKYPDLKPYLWMFPIATLFAGIYAALQNWAIRQKRYQSLAMARIAQSVAASGTQISMGFGVAEPIGLIAGLIVNNVSGSFSLLRQAHLRNYATLQIISRRTMVAAARAYSKFPKYSAPEALANSAGIHLPVLLIATLGSSTDAGHLMLALFAVQAPVALLGTAVAQVYLSRAPQEIQSGTLGKFTSETIGKLACIGIGPLLFLGAIAPFLFCPIFGENWSRAGYIVSWLTPWFIMHFISVPVSLSMQVTGHQKRGLMLQLFGLILRCGSVAAAATVDSSRLTEVYAVSGFVFYAIYLVAIINTSGCRSEELMFAVKPAIRITGFWLAGLAVAVALALIN